MYIIPIVSIAYLVGLFVMALYPGLSSPLGIENKFWAIGGMMLQLFLIIILATKYLFVEEKPVEAKDGVVVNAEDVGGDESNLPEVEARSVVAEESMMPPERIIVYPVEVKGGVYASTYLPIGRGTHIKLRDAVVKSFIWRDNIMWESVGGGEVERTRLKKK